MQAREASISGDYTFTNHHHYRRSPCRRTTAVCDLGPIPIGSIDPPPQICLRSYGSASSPCSPVLQPVKLVMILPTRPTRTPKETQYIDTVYITRGRLSLAPYNVRSRQLTDWSRATHDTLNREKHTKRLSFRVLSPGFLGTLTVQL